MVDASIGEDLSHEALSALIQAAFQGFTGAAERLEQAYAALQEHVTILNLELNDTNLRLTQSVQENIRIRHYLTNLLKSIEKGIVVIDAVGRITLWSGGAERLTGFAANEVMGQTVDRLLGETVATLIRGLVDEGGNERRECRIVRKDGCSLEVEINASPIRDERGRMLDTLLVVDDISQRKWVEERRRRSTAQAGLEQMAVTIAHGIRNPLASIELLATILVEETQSDFRKSRLAQGIQTGVASVNAILTNLLTFSRPVKPAMRPLDLTEVIEDACNTAHYALKERQIELIKDCDTAGPFEVDGDRELVKQVFLNLILNAVQAMPSGGVLTIGARHMRGSGYGVRGMSDNTAHTSGFIEVKLSDSGSGIGEENLEKIFLPFFSTKPRGAGLGLAIVERILEQHGARISLESRTGQGTTFTILFKSRCWAQIPSEARN